MKSDKQRAIELLKKLNKDELQEVLDKFGLGNESNSFADIEGLLKKLCPECGSADHVKMGKTSMGLTIYKCKKCGRRFNILSGTPLEKTRYPWNVWVKILELMLHDMSIPDIREYLVRTNTIPDIDRLTVSACCHKLRNSFIYMPVPKLQDIIQVDETHFRESQKGVKDPIDVLDMKGGRRKGRKSASPSKYGTMGPEFSTVCCAVDNHNHYLAQVVCMGHMALEDFEDMVACHFGKVGILCTDMNPIYMQYSAIHKLVHYVRNSEFAKIIKKCKTKGQKVAAYENSKLDYVIGVGVMNYDKMVKFREANNLSLGRVNEFHTDLKRRINKIARGVSTNHLQAWVSFETYRRNFKTDYGYEPLIYDDAEVILIEILKLRKHITVDDIKIEKDTTKKQPARYTKRFIAKTVNARVRSNNPYIKFSEEDGIWIVDKKKSINLLPEYKRRELAKSLGIRPFSPTSVSSADLKKKLLAHPDLEDALYILANGHTEDDRNYE